VEFTYQVLRKYPIRSNTFDTPSNFLLPSFYMEESGVPWGDVKNNILKQNLIRN